MLRLDLSQWKMRVYCGSNKLPWGEKVEIVYQAKTRAPLVHKGAKSKNTPLDVELQARGPVVAGLFAVAARCLLEELIHALVGAARAVTVRRAGTAGATEAPRGQATSSPATCPTERMTPSPAPPWRTHPKAPPADPLNSPGTRR